MRKAFAISLSLLLSAALIRSAAAQEVPVREAARMLLDADIREKVVLSDSLLDFRTQLVPGGRIDAESGIYRARYRLQERVPAGLPPTEAATEHIARAAAAYGVSDYAGHLAVEHVRQGRHSSHVRLRQTLAGLPVYGRQIKVSLDRNGQPTMVVNGFAPHLEKIDDFDPAPQISAARAVRIVQNASSRGFRTSEPELVIYPSKPPRLAWKLSAAMPDLPIEYEALVDARTGEIIRMLDVTIHAHGSVDLLDREALAQDPGNIAPASNRAPGKVQMQRVDGTGWVFDPDPLSSAGVTYGGEYVDDADADATVLTDQLFEVELRDITSGAGGLFRLEGPYVTIEGGTNPAYTPPALPSPDAFTYTRAEDHFEAVMAYYHVDKSQRYLQTLDVGFPIKEEPVRVNPRGRTDDESNFSPVDNLIRLGIGGIDDAEDADVIWHEYAHALLYYTAPEVPLGPTEGGAFHEGWADYWAASYSRYLSEVDDQIPQHEWSHVFNWDGNNGCWMGRRLNHPGHYPDNMYYTTEGCVGEKYQEGLLWATTLMEIYPNVGRAVLDRLNLASHAYLGSPFAFPDAAEALIQADLDLYDGAHSNILVHYLSERGYIDEANYGPVISHEPLPATEQTTGTVRLEVTAAATTAAIDSVIVYYGTDGSTSDRIILDSEGGDRYAGELPLPGTDARVSYYIQAVDVDNRRRTLPAAAPAETFSFDVGADTEAPTIEHQPLEEIAVAGWPFDVYAAVDDNLGVDSVWVQYTIVSPSGATTDDGTIALTSDGVSYSGALPAANVQAGGAVEYRIFANDVSQGGNLAALPESGTFRVPFVELGIVRRYDFDGIGQVLQGGGIWTRGAPSYGLQIAHSGSMAWATNTDGAYPASTQLSSLSLPSIDISETEDVYLVFWHWYDFEHNGLAEPGVLNPDAGLWDGGNVKVSVDGGTWQVAQPNGGYNGTISNDYGNPLGGQNGFGGFSYGWRQEIVPLPAAEDVRIRFDFGTDVSNEEESKFFAGWYIDDVTITTALPEDTSDPVATTLPEAHAIRIPQGEDPPLATVEVSDDTGIEGVFSEYEVLQGDAIVIGTTRFAMAETDLHVFTGPVVPFGSFSAGDRIRYEIVVRDFDGNTVRYGDPFVIDYRSEQTVQALESVVAMGAWRVEGSGWASESTDDPVSSLVLEPFTLPRNSENSTFELEHAYDLSGGVGGNVKISTNDGRTWAVLEPQAGYPSTLQASHPMDGEGAFADASASGTSVFDLSPYAGSEVRLRVDLAQARPLEPDEYWVISGASYRTLSTDPEIQTDLELALHANFPDPVMDQTTITYTIPERTAARISVYDMLGRRVALIRHANHEPGTYTVTYEPADLAAGVYVIYLETSAGTRTESMVVAR